MTQDFFIVDQDLDEPIGDTTWTMRDVNQLGEWLVDHTYFAETMGVVTRTNRKGHSTELAPSKKHRRNGRHR